jgi:ribose transport system permease protein
MPSPLNNIASRLFSLKSLPRDAKQNALIVIVLVVLIILFAVRSPYFLRARNLVTIFNAAVPLGLIAIGECLCVMCGNFDLSVGMVASMAGIISANMVLAGFPSWLAMLTGFLFGTFSGAIAGFSVGRLKMPAWMATYSLYQIWRGVLYVVTQGNAIRLANYPGYKVLGQTRIIGQFTLPILILFLFYILMFLFLRYTQPGRTFFIVGGNREAALNCGLPVKRVDFSCFVISGTLASLAGLLFASRSASAQPFVGELWAMQGIAATVVGGTSMLGGRANLLMTFAGLMIVIAIQNGLNMIGVPSFYQYIANGLILYIAVLIQTER